jgi:RNA polymerase sigma-70 factor (ECF subfamily)
MKDHSDANPRSLDAYRDYLRLLVQLRLSARLRAKIDSSDVIQQVILQAHESREQFRGESEGEWLAWLRSIATNVITSTARRFDSRAREVGKERSLDAELDESASPLQRRLVADLTSPSQRAVKDEDLLRLAQALAQLPADQRLVVELRHLKGLPVGDVADKIHRTRAAVAGLLFRGLKNLRELLGESNGTQASEETSDEIDFD